MEVIEFLKNNVFIIILLLVFFLLLFLFVKDKSQKQHSILKTHPLIGRFRYLLEMIGPEVRQYWFLNDKEGKPVDRDTQETIAKAGKYATTVMGFGSKKDFNIDDFYLSNSMFPKNVDELRVENDPLIKTYTYKILNETLTRRKEQRFPNKLKPWYLTDKDAIIVGEKREKPFKINGLIGISAMSYGSLSKSAVKALSQGVAISQGSFMNTGEGGISPYHLSKVYDVRKSNENLGIIHKKVFNYIKKNPLSSNFDLTEKLGYVDNIVNDLIKSGHLIEFKADLIFQIGSGLFGARKNNEYCEITFLENALKPEVKAIEIKLGQGAKVRGGKLPKEKITPEIAEIRGVEMEKDIESPNRFPLFSNTRELLDLIEHWQKITGKPVGIKVVAGDEDSFINLAKLINETGIHPDFISIDGGEGGTGATYQEMADSLGLPIYSGISILDKTLRDFNIRDQIKIIASGMLATANKMAIALSLGADLIYVARAAMNTIGCINAAKCHTNLCPVGVTSHLPHLEAGLVVQEKKFRTANYLTTMREGLFMLGASCGIDTPVKFNKNHVVFRKSNNELIHFSDN